MAWHSGSALSQTLFASLYIDKLLSSCPTTLKQATLGARPRAPEDPQEALRQEMVQSVLRPYCLALIKCCGYVGWQVPSERIYEVCYPPARRSEGREYVTNGCRKRISFSNPTECRFCRSWMRARSLPSSSRRWRGWMRIKGSLRCRTSLPQPSVTACYSGNRCSRTFHTMRACTMKVLNRHGLNVWSWSPR